MVAATDPGEPGSGLGGGDHRAGSDPYRRARPVAYAFLADLVERGVDESTLGWAAQLPPLDRELAQLPAQDGSPDLEAAAADHFDLFGRSLFAYQSFFLDSAALLGGDERGRVSEFFAAQGYPISQGTDPDHLATALRFLAWDLAGNGGGTGAFLGAHLMRWLPGFVVALQREGSGFFGAVAELIWDLVSGQAVGLGIGPGPEEDPIPERSVSSELLADPKTGLNDVCEFLVTPARCGFPLTRRRLAALAREIDLPRGFGPRKTELHTLMRSAIDHDQLPEVLDRLTREVDQTDGALRSLPRGRELGPWIDPWCERLGETRELLRTMAAALGPGEP